MEQLVHSAVNWSRQPDRYTMAVYEQAIKQFWVDTKMTPFADIKVWNTLSPEYQDVYMKVLGGLTLLDTEQSNTGMPSIAKDVDNLIRKTLLSNFGFMEGIHAKSYSTIFTTLATRERIDMIFRWVEQQENLQYKAQRITAYYNDESGTVYSKYMKKVASVFLESFLFYSGFFFPLYLAGDGLMTSSGEIINLIIRDELLHGAYVGRLAQDDYALLSDEEKERADKEVYGLLDDLMDNEIEYTDELYSGINLDTEVKNFLKYNANNALMNLGRDPYYEHSELNATVLVGLSTETSTFDFFSQLGNGYQLGEVVPLEDKHFDMKVNDEFIMEGYLG